MIKATVLSLLAVIAAYLLGAIFIGQGNIAAVVPWDSTWVSDSGSMRQFTIR